MTEREVLRGQRTMRQRKAVPVQGEGEGDREREREMFLPIKNGIARERERETGAWRKRLAGDCALGLVQALLT